MFITSNLQRHARRKHANDILLHVVRQQEKQITVLSLPHRTTSNRIRTKIIVTEISGSSLYQREFHAASKNEKDSAILSVPSQQHFTCNKSNSLFFSTSVQQQDQQQISTHDNNNQLTTTQQHVPASLIDFQIASKIEGEESHIVTIELRPGEILRAEAGSMIYMTEGIVMDTKMNGVSSAFNRFLTGQNVFLTDFYYDGPDNNKGIVCLGTDFPSKILRFTLEDFPNSTLICQRSAYLASNPTVNIEMEFTKTLTAGFFGGQGFILQRLTGTGDVLVKGGGTIKQLTLQQNETLRVTSGSIVAFESTVQYDVQMIPGIKNAMFGGEGLFITTLQGPGNVWLQGMPPDRMIAEIASRIPSGIGFGIPIGFGGGGGGGGAAEGAAAAGVGDAGVDASGSEEAAAANASSAAGSSEEMVAATDAAIEADRNATVASSGMMEGSGDTSNIISDADSPSALFGDAVGTTADTPGSSKSPSPGNDDFDSATADMSDASSFNEETTFDMGDDDSSNKKFDESYNSVDADGQQQTNMQDGELFNDDGTKIEGMEIPDVGEGVPESAGGIIRSLWDFFTGGD